MKPVKVVTVTFVNVGGRECLNFAGTRKRRRTPAPEELLTQPKLLSDWAVQAGLLDRGIEVAEDDLEAAIALREAIYRTVTARLEGRRPKSADVELLNEHGSHAQLTPRLDRTGAVRREGTPSQLLARLAADLLDLLAGPDIEKVKGCAHPGCSRLYVDSSRAQNRHWCGMGTCGNKAKVRAFRERQRASESGVAGVGQSRTKGSRR
jgi:predicted RNA-binding Zn ribbon-like protein